MRRFILKSILFLLPLAAWAVFIAVVDPFAYFASPRCFSEDLREKVVRPTNTLLFNVVAFDRNPESHVLIGDSRTARLDPEVIAEFTGEPWFSLYSYAAKLNEIVDLYWLAVDRTEVDQVVIGLNFNMFNAYSYADRVKGARSIVENPLLYLYNRSVARASFALIRASRSDNDVSSGTPDMSRDEFWDWNVEVKARHHYGKWAYPGLTIERLREMAEHARTSGIVLTFILVPHHQDFQARVGDFGLDEEKSRFEQEIAALGRTVNFDYPNDWTKERDLFTDPLHMSPELARRVIREVFEGPLVVGREVQGPAGDSR